MSGFTLQWNIGYSVLPFSDKVHSARKEYANGLNKMPYRRIII